MLEFSIDSGEFVESGNFYDAPNGDGGSWNYLKAHKATGKVDLGISYTVFYTGKDEASIVRTIFRRAAAGKEVEIKQFFTLSKQH